MAEIVNLRRFRKAAARRRKAEAAADNRVRHGVDKATREAARKTREREGRQLDGARREDAPEDGDGA